eukprot:gb/GEZN01021383.1/.p2 GENE.gb/GEZN01021383.1/~~gb/GEZN01021383.1/.p2  ORF type:complete len:160 (+),score=5.58 gb/GEZN01021383.1/:98-577(+)
MPTLRKFSALYWWLCCESARADDAQGFICELGILVGVFLWLASISETSPLHPTSNWWETILASFASLSVLWKRFGHIVARRTPGIFVIFAFLVFLCLSIPCGTCYLIWLILKTIFNLLKSVWYQAKRHPRRVCIFVGVIALVAVIWLTASETSASNNGH